MRRLEFKLWEKAAVALGGVLFAVSFTLYLSDIPLRKYLLGWQEEASGQRVASVENKMGTLRRRTMSESEFTPLELRATLFNGDTLVTGNESSATVLLDDGSRIQLGPNTMIRMAFEYHLSLGGVSRAAAVDVVVGQVSGESKVQTVTLRSKTEVIALTREAPQRRIKVEKPKPVPVVPLPPVPTGIPTLKKAEEIAAATPTPTPTPTPTKIPSPTVKIAALSPREGEVLFLEKGSRLPERPTALEWSITGPATQFRVILKKLPENSDVADKIVAAESGRAVFSHILKAPGAYEWIVTSALGDVDSNRIGSYRFSLAPDYQAIELQTPLVAGRTVSSNRVQEELLQDFDITFRWSPYETAKQYRIRLWNQSDTKKAPDFEQVVNENRFQLTKAKMSKDKLYYQVSSNLPSGFTVESDLGNFSFDFMPPTLSSPKNRQSFTRASLQSTEDSLLLTWKKTNFTEAYQIEIASNTEFKSPIVARKIKENFYILKGLKTGRYFWRVTSHAKNGTSSLPSAPSEFSVLR